MRRCRAWAASTARQSDTALRSLLRIQVTREKQLAKLHPAAMEGAGWWFREAVVPAPAPELAPEPEPAELELTEAQLDCEVELYAAMYPDRADLDFGPPEPHIVAGLLRRAGVLPRGAASRLETRLVQRRAETSA